MAVNVLHTLCLIVVVGSLVAVGPCHGSRVDGGRKLFQTETVTATASDGSATATSAASTTGTGTGTVAATTSTSTSASASGDSSSTATASSDGGSSATATATTGGSSGSSTATASSGSSGEGSSTSTASAGSGGKDSDAKGVDVLIEIISEIYGTVVTRVADDGDPELAARAEVNSKRFQIASAWKDVINAEGRRGRGPACRDLEEFAETQEDEFAATLVDAFAFARDEPLSEDVQEEIKDLIDLSMDEAFRDATKAACGILGFTLIAQFELAKELIEPVFEAILIALSDDGPITENGDDEISSARGQGNEDEEDGEDGSSGTPGTSIFVGTDDDSSRCMREFSVCCLPRFMSSGFCSCLVESCDARLEDGVWVDASGSTCTCP